MNCWLTQDGQLQFSGHLNANRGADGSHQWKFREKKCEDAGLALENGCEWYYSTNKNENKTSWCCQHLTAIKSQVQIQGSYQPQCACWGPWSGPTKPIQLCFQQLGSCHLPFNHFRGSLGQKYKYFIGKMELSVQNISGHFQHWFLGFFLWLDEGIVFLHTVTRLVFFDVHHLHWSQTLALFLLDLDWQQSNCCNWIDQLCEMQVESEHVRASSAVQSSTPERNHRLSSKLLRCICLLEELSRERKISALNKWGVGVLLQEDLRYN